MRSNTKNRKRPFLVYTDTDGNIYDAPDIEMAVRSGNRCLRPAFDDLIPLPEGSRLFTMPGRIPLGWDMNTGEFVTVEGCTAVAAFPPPGFTRLFLPATESEDSDVLLPLWAYTAVGWLDDQFWIAAKLIDENIFWDPGSFDDRVLVPAIEQILNEFPNNRLWKHLSRCAMDYHCFAAKNAFYRRWECPIPTSPGCNSRCIGCLSQQPDDSFEASHERITFVPTPKEIIEVALPHIEKAEDAIISFGQGCEGDPILQAEVISESVRGIRKHTDRGTLNVNTNASCPKDIEMLCKAGLDSLRVSINSATEEFYNRYYRPANYGFSDVVQSIKVAKSYGLFVSVNLLMFPGLSDLLSETDTLIQFIQETQIDLIQMRNLCIDPDVYVRAIQLGEEASMGIPSWMQRIHTAHPHIQFGYFNRPCRRSYSSSTSA